MFLAQLVAFGISSPIPTGSKVSNVFTETSGGHNERKEIFTPLPPNQLPREFRNVRCRQDHFGSQTTRKRCFVELWRCNPICIPTRLHAPYLDLRKTDAQTELSL